MTSVTYKSGSLDKGANLLGEKATTSNSRVGSEEERSDRVLTGSELPKLYVVGELCKDLTTFLIYNINSGRVRSFVHWNQH